MIQGKNKASIKMNLAKNGKLMLEKSHAKGQALPVAVSLGQVRPSSSPRKYWCRRMSKDQFAGWLQNSPIPVVRGALTGLPFLPTPRLFWR